MTDRRQALRLLRSALLTCAGSSLSVPLFAAARRQPVALLAPLTGAQAAIGTSMQRAASLVQTDPADALIALDTGDTPAAAAKLALRRGAKLILGPLRADQVRPVLAAAGAVPVVAFSNDEALLDSGAFLLGITASQVAGALVGYARGRGVRRVAVLAADDIWSRQLAAAAQRSGNELGLVVNAVSAAITDTASLQAAHGGTLPDALLVPSGGAAVPALARALRDSGVQLLVTVDALAGGPGALADLDGAWIAAPDPAPYDSFLRSYQDRHGGNAGLIAALGYDAAVVVRDLRAAGLVDRAHLLALAPVQGATGRIRFRSDGSCARPLAILVARDGGYEVAQPASAP